MVSDTSASEELDQVRKIMTGPLEEHIEMLDNKVLEVIGQMQATVFERISAIETQVQELSGLVEEDRSRMVNEIGDAMAQLGRQLRDAGRSEDTEPMPESHDVTAIHEEIEPNAAAV